MRWLMSMISAAVGKLKPDPQHGGRDPSTHRGGSYVSALREAINRAYASLDRKYPPRLFYKHLEERLSRLREAGGKGLSRQ